MKYLLRPTQINLPDAYTVRNRDQYIALDKVWKQIAKEDRERKDRSTDFASVLILRNLMIGKDMYSGFTPALRINDLKNGRGFMGGFQLAYDNLHRALKNDFVCRLRINICRMLIAVRAFPRPKEVSNVIPAIGTFDSSWYNKSYVSRVHAMVVEQIEDGVELRGKTYADLFDTFDNDHVFNVIREKDYRESRFTPEQFEVTLQEFARGWIALHQKTKDEQITGVAIQPDADWMYKNSEGDDTRSQTDLTDTIVITTKPKYNRVVPPAHYYVPVKYLWEVDWLREFMK